jgi:CRISPR-associated protein Csd1
MTVLSALAKAYERLPNAPPFGFSSEKIGFVISLNEDGSVASVTDLREGEGKKARPRLMLVPQPVKRTAGIAPNFLWDKTSYVLGVTAGEGRRTAEEHAAFLQMHLEAIGDQQDAGLRAFALFLQSWSPEQFQPPHWAEEMKDQNVIFALESDRRNHIYLHDRPAAKGLWARHSGAAAAEAQICLVTGAAGPVARLHPSIKGVWGAQSSGAALVSFNLDAFTSYSHEQGDNAPVSEAAAFAYTTALNRFLERDSGHRIQIGDASTVFWADAEDLEAAQESEAIFSLFFDGGAPTDEEKQAQESASTRKIGIKLEQIRQGMPLADVEPKLTKGVRFFVLGLAPNAARLSVRFYFEDDFGEITKNYQSFLADMRIEPPQRNDLYPNIRRYLQETAVLKKRENVAPNVAGEWLKSIIQGLDYPSTLMSSVLIRIRADSEINALRASILRSFLVRNYWNSRPDFHLYTAKEEAFVALETENPDQAYVLGRLFAVLEKFQILALGKVGASIRDRYYGAASASPRTIFPLLLRLTQHHRSKAEKDEGKRGLSHYFGAQMASIINLLPPEFPASLSLQAQGRFAIGYYHQFNYRKSEEDNSSEEGIV